MSKNDQPTIPLAAFKNIMVTVTEDDTGQLVPNCPELITCSTRDSLLNFQLTNQANDLNDYRFEQPTLTGHIDQLGSFTISKSGKMLTVCNETTVPGSIYITLNVYDALTPARKGAFDPEVVNQPDGR